MRSTRRRPKRRARRNPVRELFVRHGAFHFVTQKQRGALSVGDLIELHDGTLARVESIDAKTQKVRTRALPGADAGGLDRARNAFRAFSGMEPRAVVETDADDTPRVAWLLGELEDVTYNTERDGKRERYRHPFKKSARPMLAVDAQTGRLCLVGKGYRVTERGITDH